MANGRCRNAGHGGSSTGRKPVPNPKPSTLERRGRNPLYKNLRLHDKAEEARHDPELKSHRENIIFLEALIRAEADESFTPPRELWGRCLELYSEAISEGDKDALRELGKVLRKGMDASQRIDRLIGLMEQQRKHKESEQKREAQLQVNLNAKEVDFLVKSLYAAVSNVVKDVSQQRAIAIEFARLCDYRPHPEPDPRTE